MPIEKLTPLKTDYENKKTAAKDAISAIYSGKNSTVNSAEEKLAEKKEAYDAAVENDEKISKELKTERENNLKGIEEKESSVDALKLSINETEHCISNLDSQITSKKSDLAVLNAALSSLQSATSDDVEIQMQIKAQIGILDGKIKTLSSDIDTLEGEKQMRVDEKKGLDESLKIEEDALASLETKRTDIENRISENCNEATKTALLEYNNEKTNVQNIKTKQLDSAKKLVSDYDSELAKINNAINKLNAKNIERENHVSTSTLFDGKSNLVAQKINVDGTMPYILIGPENADPNEELPVLVYMHGSGEVGASQDALLKVGLDPIIRNWNLEDFNGYILCPQLTGKYNAGSWNNSTAEGYLRDLINDFQQNHAVDKNNIAVAGYSLGGMGSLYMAKHMEDVFSKAAVISGYNVYIDTKDINIPIIGYVGENEDQKHMKSLFANNLGEEYLVTLQAHHGNAQEKVFTRDENNNRRSDIIEWLFNDKDYKEKLPT